MDFQITVPEYSAATGMQYRWTPGFEITISLADGALHIKANKEGLESLANHLLNLAQDAVPSGTHLHLDENNALESGSLHLIIEKS